jgi:hypothetical protein
VTASARGRTLRRALEPEELDDLRVLAATEPVRPRAYARAWSAAGPRWRRKARHAALVALARLCELRLAALAHGAYELTELGQLALDR